MINRIALYPAQECHGALANSRLLQTSSRHNETREMIGGVRDVKYIAIWPVPEQEQGWVVAKAGESACR